jgi:hypothetical protein
MARNQILLLLRNHGTQCDYNTCCEHTKGNTSNEIHSSGNVWLAVELLQIPDFKGSMVSEEMNSGGRSPDFKQSSLETSAIWS